MALPSDALPATPHQSRQVSERTVAGRAIVLVTPVALSHDSRTLKQALTLSEAGALKAVIADGQPVALADAIAASASASANLPASAAGPGKPSPIRRLWAHVRAGRSAWPVDALAFALWLPTYVWRYIVRPLRHLPPADLYILHEFSQFPAVWLRARQSRAPIIYDAHDFYTGIEDEDRLPRFDRVYLMPFQKAVERRLIRRAADVWTVSNGVADLYERTYGVRPKVIRNCHDERLNELAGAPSVDTGQLGLRQRLGIADDAFLLATIGNRKPGQAIDAALDALTRLPAKVQLVLIGAGYDVNMDAIRARGLEPRVHLAGRLKASTLVLAAREADAALILYYPRSANYVSALPNGFFLGVAAGLPTIAPDLPEIRAVMQPRRLGPLIDVRDPAAIVTAVEHWVNDPAARQLTATNVATAAKELSWQSEQQLMLEAVAQVLRARDRSASAP